MVYVASMYIAFSHLLIEIHQDAFIPMIQITIGYNGRSTKTWKGFGRRSDNDGESSMESGPISA